MPGVRCGHETVGGQVSEAPSRDRSRARRSRCIAGGTGRDNCRSRSNGRRTCNPIPGLTLIGEPYESCYPATYEPSLNVFVQGQKRITLGGTTYLCDGSTFLLSLSISPWSVRSCRQVRQCHCSPCCSNSTWLQSGDSESRGVSIAQWFIRGSRHHDRENTVDLLQPCSRSLDLLDAPEDIPFLSSLIQREIVYRLLRGRKERVCAPSPHSVTRAIERRRRSLGSETITGNLCD